MREAASEIGDLSSLVASFAPRTNDAHLPRRHQSVANLSSSLLLPLAAIEVLFQMGKEAVELFLIRALHMIPNF